MSKKVLYKTNRVELSRIGNVYKMVISDTKKKLISDIYEIENKGNDPRLLILHFSTFWQWAINIYNGELDRILFLIDIK